MVDNLLDEVVELAGEGKDTVLAHTSYTLNEAASVEILKAFDVTATTSINLTGNSGANSIIGNAGANILDGQAGTDLLDGGAGDDTLVGGDGDDIIKGGAGVDTVIFSGKRGDYTFTLGSGDSLIVKGSNTDVVSATEYFSFADGTFAFSDLRQVAQPPVLPPPSSDPHLPVIYPPPVVTLPPIVTFPPFQPPVVSPPISLESDKNVTLASGVYNATAVGSSNVSLLGNELSNRLTGNSGRNVVDGWKGNDKVDGAYGNDTLYGGTGRDVFLFTTKLGTSTTDRKVNFDTVKDFSVRDDSIYLDNAIFKKLGSGTPIKPKLLNKSYFALDKAEDKNDYLIYDTKTGVLSYDADGSGKGQAVEFAQFKNRPTLKYNDFFVI